MTLLATSLLAGIGVGLSIAAPIGPTSMLCVQQTLRRGLPTGFATGFGVATVHLIYGAVAAATGAAFLGAWQDAAPLSLLSGLVLLAFSIRTLRRVVVLDEMAERPGRLASSYCGAVLFGFLNPITPILFAAATPGLIDRESDAIPITIIGVFMGSLCWWALLTSGVCVFRKRITPRCFKHVNTFAAMIMAFIALRIILSDI